MKQLSPKGWGSAGGLKQMSNAKVKRPQIRAAYGPKMSFPTDVSGPSMTQQHFKDECDINQILARYQKTGVIDHVNTYAEQYGEMDGATFTEHMQAVARAQNMFEALPSTAREHFRNDPAQFLDYISEIDLTCDDDLKRLVSLQLLEETGIQWSQAEDPKGPFETPEPPPQDQQNQGDA